MTERDLHNDDELLAALADALDAVDPVPAEAVHLAVAGFELGRVDEELAILASDSLTEAGVALRHDAGGTRALRFTAPALTIEIEVGEPIGTSVGESVGMVVGLLSPPAAADIEMETVSAAAGRQLTVVRCDELGRFRTAISPGLSRLRCQQAGTTVVTTWFSH